MAITRTHYGTLPDGRQVSQFTLRNAAGVEVRCINYGCRLTHLFVPGRKGPVDILLGFDNLEGYMQDISYQGAFVGRYANRIKNAQFKLNGKTYSLTKKSGENYLHGSFSNALFGAETVGENSLSFAYASPDGEDGFPGEMYVCVVYTLTEQNEFVMNYRARCSADTHINLTNHAYFNLAGPASGDVLAQELQLFAPCFLEPDDTFCPTGRVLPVAGTPMDFTSSKPIGRDIAASYPPLQTTGGYDHCYILQKPTPAGLSLAATAREVASGRCLQVYTTQPAVQLYTGNALVGAPGKGGAKLARHSGFCLETQHYPCSPLHPSFPSTRLEAGQNYEEVTALVLSW